MVERGTYRLSNDSGLPRKVGAGALKFHDITATIFGKKNFIAQYSVKRMINEKILWSV